MSCRQFASNPLITMTILALTLGGLSSTAQGIVVQTTNVKLNGGTADFGSGSHFFGGPTGSGSVSFDYDFAGDQIRATARVTGTLYLDSLDPGCARLDVQFLNSGGVLLTDIPQPAPILVCGPGGNANDSGNQSAVNVPSQPSPNLFIVSVRTRGVRADGTLFGGASDVALAPLERFYFTKINSGTADFGRGSHVGGAPSQDAFIDFTRLNVSSVMVAEVSGTLYWDSLFSSGCARIVIDFQDLNGGLLSSLTRKGKWGMATSTSSLCRAIRSMPRTTAKFILNKIEGLRTNGGYGKCTNALPTLLPWGQL